MDNFNSILKSFNIQNNLNPKFWEKSEKDETTKLNPEIRKRLLEIAYQFIEFLKVDIVVSDIIITGSISNYNWSKFSDIDLHIMADFGQFSKKSLPLYEELFKLKKAVFNDKHDIKIYGYDVELYVQDDTESHTSTGIYSVLNDEWVVEPKKEDFKINKELIKDKSKQWMDIIDSVIESAKDENLEDAKKIISKYKEKIKKYRSCGLEKGGEYSDENLVFKVLRRNGYIQKLFDFDNQNMDDKLTLKEATTTIGNVFKVDLENGPTNHRKRAFGNWQSDNAWDVFAPPGTVVTSYTNGVVSKIKDTGKKKGKVYGTQVTVKGSEGFPDIFYTHLKNVSLERGQEIKVGDVIGEISEWLDGPTMTHVHIGLPYGNDLKDLLKNSETIFDGKSNEITTPIKKYESKISEIIQTLKNQNSEFSKITNDQLIKTLDESNFIKNIIQIASKGSSFENMSKYGKIPYDDSVKMLQSALQFLGFSLPKWGIDGLFGPETETAVKNFKKQYGLGDDGKLDSGDIDYLASLLLLKGFKDSDLSGLQVQSDFSKINVGNDKEFYEQILKGINAPITDENLKFFYSWRQAEGGKATNNPFNTTMKLKSDPDMTNYNKVGVKNYSKPNYGVEATVKTITNGYYSCLVDGLKNNIGAENLAKCLATTKWGTGDLALKVVKSDKINPPQIYT